LSLLSLLYHIVFSTKGRKSFLDDEKTKRLCEYIVGIARNTGGNVHIVNGPADHIHIAASLNSQTSLAEFVRTTKTNTSRWIHKTFADMHDFAWQDGYSAFTVSYSGLSKVIEYIKGQQEHHKKISFDEELVAFLQKHEIDYDDRFIGG
jgi:REP element-mobilizing transposase RayT